MIEPSALGAVQPTVTTDTQVFPQSLPSNRAGDATRFQDLMSGIGQLSTNQATLRDQPILQRVKDSQSVDATDASLKNNIINQMSGMDKSYHSIMDQLRNRPDFAEYLESYKRENTSPLRTYPDISPNGKDDSEQRMQAMLDDMKINNAAATNYQKDMTAWTMNFQMWNSGVELISSMVSQVSRGFQTLFRASG